MLNSGMYVVVDDNQTEMLILQKENNNLGTVTQDIADILHLSRMSIARHLGERYSRQCLGALRFKGKKLMGRISLYDSLLKRNKNDRVLKRIAIGDEKGMFTTMWRRYSGGRKRNE